MTTFLFSTVQDGATIEFAPEADVLVIDSSDLSASDFWLTASTDGTSTVLRAADGGKSITVQMAWPGALDASNVVFADGSLLVSSSMLNNYGSQLAGSAHDDLLLGGPPVRSVELTESSVPAGVADGSSGAQVSADGRFVVFGTYSSSFFQEDGMFVKDLQTGEAVPVYETSDDWLFHDDGQSYDAVISANGRYVAFLSTFTRLVEGDTNGQADVFLKDMLTGELTRISTNSEGEQSSGGGIWNLSMSADGRYVTFVSDASDLVQGDTNNVTDVFVKDTQTGVLTRVSTTSDGDQADPANDYYGSSGAEISADGRFVVFASYANNLVEGDEGRGDVDVYVKNLQTGEIVCVNAIDGADTNGYNPTISADGRYVVFESSADLLHDGQDGLAALYMRDMQTGALTRVKGTSWQDYGSADVSGDGRFVVFTTQAGLVDDDTNWEYDVYVKDTQTGQLAKVSQGFDGSQTNDLSGIAHISLDGSTIVFQSNATNIVAGAKPGYTHTYSVANPLFSCSLAGGAGNDAYVVNSTADQVVENAGEGTDTVRASIDYILTPNVENLVLTGAAQSGTGNALANEITGNAAANTLDGAGGADTLTGGEGDDTYLVDGADTVVELDGGGTDTMKSSVSCTLASNVERLVLTGTGDVNGTGNLGANTLLGNAGDNVLDGKAGNDTASYESAEHAVVVDLSIAVAQATGGAGSDTLASIENLKGSAYADTLKGSNQANVIDGGAGADTMTGGLGDDTFVVDDVGDRVLESSNGGVDGILASLSWTLGNQIENLTLTGASAINASGNSLANTLTGNDAANVLDGGAGADTMIGGLGGDTYVVDNTADQVIDVSWDPFHSQDTVRSSVSWTLGDTLEDLTLTGSAAINGTGNDWNNEITGNVAANVLTGGKGADTLVGGGGNDTYILPFDVFSEDTIVEEANGGIDEVVSATSYELGAELENLTLTGEANFATGNDKANRLTGTVEINIIDGRGGADTMIGGDGSDSYVVDDAGDVVVETTGGGTFDQVEASVSWTMGAYVESLRMTGSAAINATGNAQDNRISGNDAANVLDGGAGADWLDGGNGDDTYIVDNIHDETHEVVGAGVDTVRSSVSFTLSSNVEKFLLTGTAAINGTGNTLANTITGNSAANVLNGGAGADTLTGGAGSDTYVVDNAGDKTVEVAAGGTDLVQSSITFTLQTEVEKLTLTGTAAIKGTGNTLANTITGNSAANVLNGGAGADTLTGGAGSDTYVVDNAGDKTVEVAAGGTDLVQSSITFTLQTEVEKLTLTGTAAINGTGNSAANTIVGNSAANTIDGRAGTDTLTGGAGNDIFAFTTAAASDLITDFSSGADKLRLSQAAIKIGDGDTVVEGAVSVTGPNGFANSAELVIITHNISGSITASSAAAAIGHANSAYQVGDNRLFVVDNGIDSAVYRFRSADANATITASELTLVASLDNTHATVTTDYLFGA